jgi:hypothetical protein
MNGMFGGFQVPQTSLPQLSAPEPKPAPKGGMFGGKPDWASAIQAVIGGYLSGMGAPGGRELLGQVHQRQMMAQQQAMMQQQRQADMEDFEKKQQIELRYRPPAQPTEYERLLQAMGVQPGTPDYQEHVGRYVGAKENPIVMTPYGPMPYSAVTGQQATKPVGKLTPIDDGGPTAPPSAMFPRPF